MYLDENLEKRAFEGKADIYSELPQRGSSGSSEAKAI